MDILHPVEVVRAKALKALSVGLAGTIALVGCSSESELNGEVHTPISVEQSDVEQSIDPTTTTAEASTTTTTLPSISEPERYPVPPPRVETITTTTTTIEQLSEKEQLLAGYELFGDLIASRDFQPGEKAGFYTDHRGDTYTLVQSADPFTKDFIRPEFLNYNEEDGAKVGIAFNYEPGLAVNATLGAHNKTQGGPEAEGGPFFHMGDIQPGDETKLTYEIDTDQDELIDTVVELTYVAVRETIEVDPSATHHTTDQEFDIPQLTEFACDSGVSQRKINRHELESVIFDTVD